MRLSLIAAVTACLVGSVMGADHIASQRREGSKIIVVYDSGRVSTNALFLAMSPEVKEAMHRRKEDAALLAGIRAVVADTKSNIVEASALSDMDVAGLYAAQMKKPVDALLPVAPTNTVEFIIGAGMRQDIGGGK